MLHAFLIEQPHENLQLVVDAPATYPLSVSANPIGKSKLPLGIFATKGTMYGSGTPHLPALFIHHDGGTEIREQYRIEDVDKALHVCAGSFLMLKNHTIVPVPSPVSQAVPMRENEELWRSAVGVRRDGALIHVTSFCTVDALARVLWLLDAVDALLLAPYDAYFEYEEEKMGTRPVTVLEARNVRNLPRPIVVIDPGHGGVNSGAVYSNTQEKDLALRHSIIIRTHLVNGYIGTFLLLRNSDVTMTLAERVAATNAIGANLFISVHSNAATNVAATGFESFVGTAASHTTRAMQAAVHNPTADFLEAQGFPDRGMKQRDFFVINTANIKVPAMLMEYLFMSNAKDMQALQTLTVFRGMCVATAEGIARALNLQRMQTGQPVAARPSNQLYTVQVGTFASKVNADQIAHQLKELGFSSTVVKK